MIKYLIGIDGGASKTRCLITTLDGSPVSTALGGCANKNKTGWAAAILQVRLTIIDALAKGDVLPEEISSAHYGLGGVAGELDEKRWLDNLQDLAPNAPITIENDVFLPIHAFEEPAAIGVVSGSGGSIGAISPRGKIHLDGHVSFRSAQLGKEIQVEIKPQVEGKQKPGKFMHTVLELANLTPESWLAKANAEPKQLIGILSPLIGTLYQQGHEEAKRIVHSWLNLVQRDIKKFQVANDLENLSVCLGGATFSSLKEAILNDPELLNVLVATISMEEAAIKAAARSVRKLQ